MGILYTRITLLLFIGLSISANAQITVFPSTTSCTCDGTLTYEPDPGSPGVFSLFSSDGTLLNSTNQVNGIATFTGLCPSIFEVQAITPNGTFSEYVQIFAQDGSAGLLGSLSLCSGTAQQNLAPQVSSIISGGVWRKPSGATFNGIYNPNIDNSGVYTYTVDINGCENTTGVVVNEIQNANAGIQTTYIICDSYASFEMFDFLEGNPDPGGQWLNSSGQTFNGVYDPATMNSGFYVYSLNSVPGCPAVFNTMVIQENTTPNAGINTSIVVCQNSPSFSLFNQLQGNPDPGGFWFTPSNTPFSGNFNPSIHPAGNYRYVVTAPAPCSDQEVTLNIQFVSENPSGESATLTVCTNGEAIDMIDALNGSPLDGGTWRNASGQIINSIYNPSTDNPGTFYYYYPNVGCSPSQVPLTITEVNTPEAGSNSTHEFCLSNQPIDLFTLLNGGEIGGSFYDETGNAISSSFDISGSQLTTVEYRVASSVCPTDIAQITIGVVSPPQVPASTESSFCITENQIDLESFYSLANPHFFSNENGVLSSSLIDLVPGLSEYSITSLSGNVCPNSSASITIQVDTLAFSGSNYSQDVCADDSPFALDQFILPEKINFGSWFNNIGASISGNVSIASAGNYQYFFISNISNACPQQQIELVLNVSESFTAGMNNSVDLCIEEGNYDLSNLLENSDFNGTWRYLGQSVSTSFPLVSAGNFILEYEVPSNGACPSDVSEHFISVYPTLQIDAGPDQAICSGTANIVVGEEAQTDLTYTWTPSINLLDPNSSQTEVVSSNTSSQPITTLYTLTASNGFCDAIDEVSVSIFPIPNIQAGADQSVCIGENVTITALGGNSYNWLPSDLFSDPTMDSQIFAPSNSLLITLFGQNQYGCENQDEINITVFPNPAFDADIDPISACPPLVISEEIVDSSDDIIQYSWQLNDVQVSNQSSLNITLNEEGIYDLFIVATNLNGCTDTLHYDDIITVYTKPDALFSLSPFNPTILNNEVQFVNSSENALNYFWTFGAGESSEEESPTYIFQIEEPQRFTNCLVATSEFGCTDTLCKDVYIENDFVFFAPNAFTPDNDGVNDVFRVYFQGFEESTFEISIYDRWGNEVFSSNDPNEVWQGNQKGGDYYLQDGIYQWRAKLKVDLIADYQVFEGHVTLLR